MKRALPFILFSLCTLLFSLYSFDDTKVALRRFEEAIPHSLSDQVAAECGALTTPHSNPFETRLLEKLRPSRDHASTRPACSIRVEVMARQPFRVQSRWSYAILIEKADGSPLFQKSFVRSFPRPAFLAVGALLLPLAPLRYALPLFLVLIAGGNPLSTLPLLASSAKIPFASTAVLLSLVCILLGVLLERRLSARRPQTRRGFFARKALLLSQAALGIWNPALYTLVGPLPGQRGVPFLRMQAVFVCLSLYLLTTAPPLTRGVLLANFLLPRYFTFGLLLLVAIGIGYSRSSQLQASSQRKRPFRTLAIRFALFALAWTLPEYLTRTGLTDLVVSIANPAAHPNHIVLFVFLGAALVSLFTGSLSIPLFGFISLSALAPEPILFRAALLEGIVFGVLLSPFSIFNLFAIHQCQLRFSELAAVRIRQLGLPFGMAVLVYASATLQTVAVLRPITFLFLSFGIFTLLLSQAHWRLREIRPL